MRAPAPFVKWPGGKRSVLPAILERSPSGYSAYYEPFLGGGAVFFALERHSAPAYLSDTNARLIATYRAVRDTPDDLAALLDAHAAASSEQHYLEVRSRFNTPGEMSVVETAAAFIYLNRNCYNGLYRENASGGFNASWRDTGVRWEPDVDAIFAASAALQSASLSADTFEMTPLDPNGYYYLDPPYHGTFARYSGAGFDDDAHRRLAQWCRRLDRSGARWMLSNSDTPFVRELYRGFAVDVVKASRRINCSGSGRGKVSELLIRNFEVPSVSASEEGAA